MMRLFVLAAIAAVRALAVDPAPLPPEIRNARVVHLVNQSDDLKVFDHLYDKLAKWKRWSLAEDPRSADLLLVFAANDRYLGQLSTGTTTTATGSATQTGNILTYSGRSTTRSSSIPLITMSRYLFVVDAKSKKVLLAISCERRLGSGYTAGVLINRLRKRFPKAER